MLLEKDRLNSIEVLIFKTLINSCISHDEFVSVSNKLREYNEDIKTFVLYMKTMETYFVICKKNTKNKN